MLRLNFLFFTILVISWTASATTKIEQLRPRAAASPSLTTTASARIPSCDLDNGDYPISWGNDDVFTWVGKLPSNSSTSASASTSATPTASSATFSCTTMSNPEDPQYPCQCSDGREYCNNGGTCESITSAPAMENCCLDCM